METDITLIFDTLKARPAARYSTMDKMCIRDRYKVLALDLDGTLTNTEKVITPRTKAALHDLLYHCIC